MTDTITADPVTRYVGGREFRNLIGGEFVEAGDGATSEVVDPSTGRTVSEVPESSSKDVELAVESARRAQPGWEALGVDGRSACFARFGELLQERREEMAMLDAIDSGNPVKAMRIDVDICMPYIEGWPAMARTLRSDVIPASPGNLHYTSYAPYRVVGRITAFNHPVMFAVTRRR
jgi:acyl-CoA reductase-like NAD-dependent aldehyde dehydrogenase